MPIIYGSENSFRTKKALIAAKLANANVQVVNELPPKDKFPLGVIPALEDGDIRLFGADSIAFYLLNDKMGSQKNEELVQWLQWAEGYLLPNVLSVLLPSVSAAVIDKKVVDQNKLELISQLETFNSFLLNKTYLVGERISFADISVALNLVDLFKYVLDKQARSKIINVVRWFMTIMNQPSVKNIMGDVVLAEHEAHFDKKTHDALLLKRFGKSETQTDHRQQNKQLKEDQKVNSAKKEKKGAMKREADDEMDVADEVLMNEPKATDPFASMPKGTFVLDAFKRVYSNEDTATKAIPYFWENFDAENFSIWFSEYKYPEELTLTFMSCNLISGMFQRLEKLKKNAFASVCLFGTNNNSSISGIWIWRGHELVFTLCPDWQVDYESYDWKKLDPTDEKTKELIREYFMWEGDFGGKVFNQGKIFK